MIHPDTDLRYISPEIGWGVVATKLIPKGTITWVFDPLDQVFTPDDIRLLHRVYRDKLQTYCYRDNEGNFVLCWDNARFVNHSFNSSCMSTPYNFEIAVRDIHRGEELTDDYGYLNLTEPFDAAPEPGSSRSRVMPDDLLSFHDRWDTQLRDAFRLLSKVQQPMIGMLEKKHLQKVADITSGKAELDSIINCYYPGRDNVFAEFQK